MPQLQKSNKLENVCYDIRGPVLATANQLEEDGHRILKLNIGNPAAFGFEAPDEILQDVIANLPEAQKLRVTATAAACSQRAKRLCRTASRAGSGTHNYVTYFWAMASANLLVWRRNAC